MADSIAENAEGVPAPPRSKGESGLFPAEGALACSASLAGLPRLVTPRCYNKVSVVGRGDVFQKTSQDIAQLSAEARWYQSLPKDLRYSVPNFLSFSVGDREACLRLEYLPYHSLHWLLVDRVLSLGQWETVLGAVRAMLNAYSKHKAALSAAERRLSLRDVYVEKTRRRVGFLRGNPRFAWYFSSRLTVNGVECICLEDLPRVYEVIEKRLCSGNDPFVIVHGDLGFANILVSDDLSEVKFVDPRDGFGTTGVYGDPLLETAKIMQAVLGYYCHLAEGRFSIAEEGPEVTLSVEAGGADKLRPLMFKVFSETVSSYEHELMLIVALLYISAAPLHVGNERRQAAMLSTGLLMLSEWAKGDCTAWRAGDVGARSTTSRQPSVKEVESQ